MSIYTTVFIAYLLTDKEKELGIFTPKYNQIVRSSVSPTAKKCAKRMINRGFKREDFMLMQRSVILKE